MYDFLLGLSAFIYASAAVRAFRFKSSFRFAPLRVFHFNPAAIQQRNSIHQQT
jgi:hypothetical protein